MRNWEYATVTSVYESESWNTTVIGPTDIQGQAGWLKTFNALGREGWELVSESVTDFTGNGASSAASFQSAAAYRWMFKRRVAE